MASSEQRPLELILARNFLSSISTPAVLVNGAGDALFYNEAAGALFGRRFEDTGAMTAQEWTSNYGPLRDDGTPIPLEDQPMTKALRANRAAHARHLEMDSYKWFRATAPDLIVPGSASALPHQRQVLTRRPYLSE